MKDKEVLVILSGGQDSTTCLFWARQNFKGVHAVTFDYGQRHIVEIDAAREVAGLAEVLSHEVVKIDSLKGMSPLTDPDQELEQYDDYDSMDQIIGDRIEVTFVPMRNALFLTLAANRSICADVYHMVTGICEADNANYPDCRKSFVDSQETTINEALGVTDFKIHTPLIAIDKANSVLMALEIPGAYEALAWTHTAYDGAYPPTGRDHATILRAYGFEQAGVPDPLIIRAWHEGLMDLPDTANYSKELADWAVNTRKVCEKTLVTEVGPPPPGVAR